MYNLDSEHNPYHIDKENAQICFEILSALNLGLHAVYLYVVKSNLNEVESDLAIKFNNISLLSNLLTKIPECIATDMLTLELDLLQSTILKHFRMIDEIAEFNNAKAENRAVRSKISIILEMHNKVIRIFNLPPDKVYSTLNEVKFAPVAYANMPHILDCLYMYIHAALDQVQPFEKKGCIAYKQLNFDISEDEMELDVYRTKFDKICQNLREATTCLEHCIRIFDYIKLQARYPKPLTAIKTEITYCEYQYDKSISASFASILMV